MRWPVWILLLLLALWIFLGLYFWNTNPFSRSNASDDPCVVSWELDGVVKSDATFNFIKSSAKMDKLDAGLTDAINKISKYLKDNKDKNLTITGYHDLTETFEPSLYDLSMARANAVKSLLTNKGVAASQVFVVPEQYKDEKKSKCLQGNRLNRGVSFYLGKPKK